MFLCFHHPSSLFLSLLYKPSLLDFITLPALGFPLLEYPLCSSVICQTVLLCPKAEAWRSSGLMPGFSFLSWILFPKKFDSLPWLWPSFKLKTKTKTKLQSIPNFSLSFRLKCLSFASITALHLHMHKPQLLRMSITLPVFLNWVNIILIHPSLWAGYQSLNTLRTFFSCFFNSPWPQVSKSYRFKLQNSTKIYPPFISIITAWLQTIMISFQDCCLLISLSISSLILFHSILHRAARIIGGIAHGKGITVTKKAREPQVEVLSGTMDTSGGSHCPTKNTPRWDLSSKGENQTTLQQDPMRIQERVTSENWDPSISCLAHKPKYQQEKTIGRGER